MFTTNLSSLPRTFRRYIEEYIKEVQHNADIAVERAKIKTRKEFSDYRARDLRRMFAEAITRFYDDYTPVASGYHRTGSLYKLLDLGFENGILSYIDFNPSNMTAYRSGYRDVNGEGDGLYDKVFKQGWHGGADHQSPEKDALGKDPHPDPGTPYWRAGPYFSVWAGPAAVAEISPYQDFKANVEASEAADGSHQAELNRIFQSHFIDEFNKLNIKGGALHVGR